MKHDSIRKSLIFYLDNELSENEKAAVERHLEECADCRNFLVFLRKGMQVIEDEKKSEELPFFYTRLSAKLEEIAEPGVQRQWSRLAHPILFSLILALGIYGGLQLGSNASSFSVKQPAVSNIQMLDDFETEPIESFLLSNL